MVPVPPPVPRVGVVALERICKSSNLCNSLSLPIKEIGRGLSVRTRREPEWQLGGEEKKGSVGGE